MFKLFTKEDFEAKKGENKEELLYKSVIHNDKKQNNTTRDTHRFRAKI